MLGCMLLQLLSRSGYCKLLAIFKRKLRLLHPENIRIVGLSIIFLAVIKQKFVSICILRFGILNKLFGSFVLFVELSKIWRQSLKLRSQRAFIGTWTELSLLQWHLSWCWWKVWTNLSRPVRFLSLCSSTLIAARVRVKYNAVSFSHLYGGI